MVAGIVRHRRGRGTRGRERMTRHFNFSAGPAMLPTAVIERARDELLEYDGTGMSVSALAVFLIITVSCRWGSYSPRMPKKSW